MRRRQGLAQRNMKKRQIAVSICERRARAPCAHGTRDEQAAMPRRCPTPTKPSALRPPEKAAVVRAHPSPAFHGAPVSLYIPSSMTCCHVRPRRGQRVGVLGRSRPPSPSARGVLAEAGEHLRAPRLPPRRALHRRDARAARARRRGARARCARPALDVAVYDDGARRADRRVVPRGRATSRATGASTATSRSAAGRSSTPARRRSSTRRYPADLLAYVNAPDWRRAAGPRAAAAARRVPDHVRHGQRVHGDRRLRPPPLKAKTGIASRRLRPTLALIDPTCTPHVAARWSSRRAASTSSATRSSRSPRARTPRAAPATPGASDEPGTQPVERRRAASRRCASRASTSCAPCATPADAEAREALSWAATLAGIAFGNAGVHLPHAMSYAVAGLVRDFRCAGLPAGRADGAARHLGGGECAERLSRHGGDARPERHLEAARGARRRCARRRAAATRRRPLARRLVAMMRAPACPTALGALGYGAGRHRRAYARRDPAEAPLDNAPLARRRAAMRALFRGALAVLVSAGHARAIRRAPTRAATALPRPRRRAGWTTTSTVT